MAPGQCKRGGWISPAWVPPPCLRMGLVVRTDEQYSGRINGEERLQIAHKFPTAASAYEVYRGPKEIKDAHGNVKNPAVLYRKIFGPSRLVSIEYVGVWKTVSSLGTFLICFGQCTASLQMALIFLRAVKYFS
ncbi:hypothetical protein DB88DRAFT_475709 [Papiliotrema laurentii]|uniref:Uncharacterized protein n=1 Tax=Papiliotrema laurentii TaxID=5418 RepID=A0AAD9FLE9_PAPLA|nr:hypothetical protein DB88DRAFT_475709 [Papiliotrema laurentii]